MDELSFAEETTGRMKDLYGLAGNHEVIRRTIISRIYYSAHHLSRYLLRRVGLRPETWRRNVHQRVIDEAHRRFVATNMMNAQIVPFLEIMRRHRVNADYQLHLIIIEKVFQSSIINQCQGVFICQKKKKFNVIDAKLQ